jgi:SAM-dependent methyltransferase
MFEHDTPKDEYIQYWGGGYVEAFGEGYPANAEELVLQQCLLPFAAKDKAALEIGCGGGLWTLKHLEPNFQSVTCLDVIPEPAFFSGKSMRYIQVPDKNFECYGVPDSSIDFVWSFGTFCHLSGDACKRYLEHVRRVLKPNGQAVIMFGNWVRHNNIQPRSEEFSNIREYSPTGCIWFYCDHILVEKWCLQAGLLFTDMLPTFRDTMAYIRPMQ